MTYEQLLKELAGLTPEQLRQAVTVHLADEYHHIRSIGVAVEDGVLDEDHLVLSEEGGVKTMKKYVVPVYWTTSASAIVEAESIEDAADLATGMDLDTFENAEYCQQSFEVAWDLIETLESAPATNKE